MERLLIFRTMFTTKSMSRIRSCLTRLKKVIRDLKKKDLANWNRELIPAETIRF